MAHVCLWENFMDTQKRGTKDYAKAVVAAKRMLELMGPDQKDDRERIEEMIMSASRKLRDRSKVQAKMASKQSRPFKAGAEVETAVPKVAVAHAAVKGERAVSEEASAVARVEQVEQVE